MKDAIQRLARGASVVLAVAMLLIAVVKAQGCRKDEKLMPATKAGPFMEGEAQPPSFHDAAIDGTLTKPASDAGAPSDAASDAAGVFQQLNKPPREYMLPASKSGGFEFDRSKSGYGLSGVGNGNGGLGIGNVGKADAGSTNQAPVQQNAPKNK